MTQPKRGLGRGLDASSVVHPRRRNRRQRRRPRLLPLRSRAGPPPPVPRREPGTATTRGTVRTATGAAAAAPAVPVCAWAGVARYRLDFGNPSSPSTSANRRSCRSFQDRSTEHGISAAHREQDDEAATFIAGEQRLRAARLAGMEGAGGAAGPFRRTARTCAGGEYPARRLNAVRGDGVPATGGTR